MCNLSNGVSSIADGIAKFIDGSLRQMSVVLNLNKYFVIKVIKLETFDKKEKLTTTKLDH